MSIDPLSDAKIVDSWYKNAAPWIVAVRERQIASRRLITDRSIVDAVVSCGAKTVVDIGCGEGWLTRELAVRGMEVLGVDIVPELIETAQKSGTQRFALLSYEEIAMGKLSERFDLAVANFSLLGDESVMGLFRSMKSILHPQGHFIVQTMHPTIAGEENPDVDGWRAGTWTGFSNDFTDPAPWYFRTFESWVDLYSSNGFNLVEIREPIHPQTNKPASAIFIGKLSIDF
jgi:2-polyprenyl-3-methyl-5-hydroxy-6-metoxy-1,4-benzoquinol methylase